MSLCSFNFDSQRKIENKIETKKLNFWQFVKYYLNYDFLLIVHPKAYPNDSSWSWPFEGEPSAGGGAYKFSNVFKEKENPPIPHPRQPENVLSPKMDEGNDGCKIKVRVSQEFTGLF